MTEYIDRQALEVALMFQVVRITPEDAPKPDDFCSYGERREE